VQAKPRLLGRNGLRLLRGLRPQCNVRLPQFGGDNLRSRGHRHLNDSTISADPSAKHRSLLDPLGAVRPFNRVVGPNQAFRIIGRPGAHRDVACQFALCKLVAVNLKV
jgi:hypothetical protein